MVKCFTNKVVFQDKNTLELDRFVRIKEYNVQDVRRGETFVADCNFAWSLWMNQTDGFLLLGGGTAGEKQMGIPLTVKDGLPMLFPGAPLPAMIQPDFNGYPYSEVTGIDGSFVVSYTWPFSWIPQETVIHVIAERTSDGLKWRVVPRDEPTIPDGPHAGGWKLTARSNGEAWGVELTRGTKP